MTDMWDVLAYAIEKNSRRLSDLLISAVIEEIRSSATVAHDDALAVEITRFQDLLDKGIVRCP